MEKQSKFITYSLYLFYFMEGIGAVGLTYGAFVVLTDALRSMNETGIGYTLFIIGACICIFDMVVKILNKAGVELKLLDDDSKGDVQ